MSNKIASFEQNKLVSGISPSIAAPESPPAPSAEPKFLSQNPNAISEKGITLTSGVAAIGGAHLSSTSAQQSPSALKGPSDPQRVPLAPWPTRPIYDQKKLKKDLKRYDDVFKFTTQTPQITPFMFDDGQVALLPNNHQKIERYKLQFILVVGAKIFEDIQNGLYADKQANQNPPAVGEEEISYVMWYLQALAAKKASVSSGDLTLIRPFKKGAMLIEDKEGRLKHFFDLANSYSRSSIHFPQFQDEADCSPRGVDLMDCPMPNKRKSVLYQKLPQGVPSEGANLLYVKMEPYGARGLSMQSTGHSLAVTSHNGAKSTGFFGYLKRFFFNLGQAIARCFSKNGVGEENKFNNLEYLPHSILLKFCYHTKNLNNKFGDYPLLKPIVDNLLMARRHLKTAGIWFALHQLEEAERLAAFIDEEGEVKERFNQTLADVKQQLLQSVGDHPQIRFGREVILTKDEFAGHPRLLVEPMETMVLRCQHQLTKTETEFLEKKYNSKLALQGDEQEELINRTAPEIGRLAQVKLFDALPNYDGPFFKTMANNPPNNLRGQNVNEAPLAGEETEAHRLAQALFQLSGSPQFTNSVMTLINKSNFSDLRLIADSLLRTRSGELINSVRLSSKTELILTRRTPRSSEGHDEPKNVEYDFEILVGGSTPVGGGGSGKFFRYEGETNYRLNLRLSHDTESDTVTAKVVDGVVNFEFDKIPLQVRTLPKYNYLTQR
ncbi:MAG: hypothetical protein LBV23_10085 [Deltaproteobacteria bacterium]|nr:hypothetical protein [Deltaproteobacteria bacterium]